MNSEIMPGWMDYTVIRTYLSSVCLYQTLDFREVPSVYSILFYSILLYLSLCLSYSLIRSLLSIDPSMTSEERRGEREEEREREREREREGNLVIL